MIQRQRHIAIVTETFPPEINGVANTLGKLCEGLRQRGHRLSVVRPGQRKPASEAGTAAVQGLADRMVAVPGFPIPGYADLQFGLSTSRRLARDWKANRPDVIYVATEGPLGLMALNAARKLQIPVCSGFHTNFHSYSRHYGYGFLERMIVGYLRWFHNRTQLTLVPTRKMQSRLNGLGIQPVSVWSRGVDCDRFSPGKRDRALREGWGVGERDLAVIYVGRLAAEKNLQLAVTAFERLRNIHPRAKFILVGDGPMGKKLRDRHKDYIFCGMQRGNDLARHYASADLFLFPSKTETFGNVVTEAMASGLALVAFDDGAASEHIRSEANGIKVPLDDHGGFVDATLRLADQPSLVSHLRSQARLDALDIHWPSLIEQFENIVFNLQYRETRHAGKQSVSIL
ncbi:glycosyltransferase family 1 protein [Marinobacter nanhaiticus D15-8W]|uniref:Glycosyltransferase family 1 protein n=1 Tax=Marinobacter nanhaiticus D15-8W TaxID=626887 RepID=N6X6K9_9GAMM|nr:glycosyltransferase family 1 protein [Marinobacter nanhaiticus]ENO16723.1 glycosyltransferase family 1 protein [Marinobacter nanhaiticus D15-8W]BES72528.1 glycosyltransferase family 1 protein [Marinobacter nanhaiticus D15-8W]